MSTRSQSPSPSPSRSPIAVKKPPPIPWTHHETLNLIQAYQEKWYSLERGPLKASQWEEVAVTVTLRCGYDHTHSSAKSGTQCCHKIEKLRIRYRAEKKRGGGCTGCWPYFDLMESLERGPMPISARPLTGQPNNDDDDDDDDDEENVMELEKDDGQDSSDKWKSNGYTKGRRRKKQRREDVGDEVGVELAAEIREFARRLVRMEKRKMNMMRESERWRVDMENKRIKMIVDSHTQILHIIATTFPAQLHHPRA